MDPPPRSRYGPGRRSSLKLLAEQGLEPTTPCCLGEALTEDRDRCIPDGFRAGAGTSCTFKARPKEPWYEVLSLTTKAPGFSFLSSSIAVTILRSETVTAPPGHCLFPYPHRVFIEQMLQNHLLFLESSFYCLISTIPAAAPISSGHEVGRIPLPFPGPSICHSLLCHDPGPRLQDLDLIPGSLVP